MSYAQMAAQKGPAKPVATTASSPPSNQTKSPGK